MAVVTDAPTPDAVIREATDFLELHGALDQARAVHALLASLAATTAERDEERDWREGWASANDIQVERAEAAEAALGKAEAELLAANQRNEELAKLLARVEPELVPNHDTAQELADKFGFGTLGSSLVPDIRAALLGADRG